jgi:hypothetical protein
MIKRAATDKARGESVSAPRAIVVAGAIGVAIASVTYKALRS